jgi:serine O-acetyltransferase
MARSPGGRRPALVHTQVPMPKKPPTNATTGRRFMRERARKHPPFVHAVLADAQCACSNLGRDVGNATRYRLALEAARLALVSDAFIGLVLYRCKARLEAFGIPVLPHLAHRLAIATAGVSIGTPVLIEAGIYLPHGQVVVDGFVKVGAGTAIRPWVTIGLLEGIFEGPKIGRKVRIGTGAKILGPVTIGDRALIGANAVVMRDVPSGATAVGAPARVIET